MIAALVCLAAAFGAPDVVLLSVDTLRADQLAIYGGDPAIAPNLNQFANESVVFLDAVCEVPLTAPSFSAMLSSFPPRRNGCLRNGLPLTDATPLLAETFRAAGYQTYCVQSNWTLKARLSKLNRGLDVYDDNFHRGRWGFVKSERPANEVTDRALELIDKRDAARPFFLWAHYSDPHAPYRTHRGFSPLEKPRNAEERLRARYASEVAFADAQIARLLAALPRENTVVLFVADHGESLHEHGELGHGRKVYQTTLRIPFMLRAPGLTPRIETAPVRGMDVAPTLLGRAGLTPWAGVRGVDVIQTPPAMDRLRIVETYGGAVPKVPGAKALMAHRPPQRQAALREGWKLILGGDAPELYDLRTDPQEMRPQPDTARTEPLRDAITTWERELGDGAVATDAPLQPADVEALKSLGYL